MKVHYAIPRPVSRPLLPLAAADTCESLAKLALPHSTRHVGAGRSRRTNSRCLPERCPPFPGSAAPSYENLPAFCRVAATLKPTSDSEIKIEVWMPAPDRMRWNWQLESVGNGAWAGSISYRDLATAVTAGYAAASTDTGTSGNHRRVCGRTSGTIDRFRLSLRSMK